MKNFIVLRGLPGSGKTYRARQLALELINAGTNSIVIYSTDDFFLQDNQYKFNPYELRSNHNRNFVRTLAALRQGIEDVILDNVNLRHIHYLGYLVKAQQMGYRISEIEMTEFPISEEVVAAYKERQIHAVPDYVYDRMVSEYEPGPAIGKIDGYIEEHRSRNRDEVKIQQKPSVVVYGTLSVEPGDTLLSKPSVSVNGSIDVEPNEVQSPNSSDEESSNEQA